MSTVDTRNVARDSLFLFAELGFEGRVDRIRVKVRNLSAGGMMADGGGIDVARGDRITVNLRNVGAVPGTVAWVQGSRFGIAFENEIDPKLPRTAVETGGEAPRYTRSIAMSKKFTDYEGPVRKI